MKKVFQKNQLKARRQARVRAKIFGTAGRPRLSVFRSLKQISAQLIDDQKGVTLLSVSDREAKTGKTKTEKAASLGAVLAEKALAQNIKEVVFDRGAYRFHGRIKALADSAREAGLKI